MALTKAWRSKLKATTEVRIEALDDTVLIRQMTAARQGAINAAYPAGEDGKPLDGPGCTAAFIADSVVTESGELLFTVQELLTEVSSAAFNELTTAVAKVIWPELPKN